MNIVTLIFIDDSSTVHIEVEIRNKKQGDIKIREQQHCPSSSIILREVLILCLMFKYRYEQKQGTGD